MITNAKPKDVNEYIARFPAETQRALKQIRSTIRKLAPDAEETISYGIPTFKQYGHYLIYFAGYKKHVSLYPAPRGKEPFKKILAAYAGGKGTVQFSLDEPLPMALITKIVRFRIKENKLRNKQ